MAVFSTRVIDHVARAARADPQVEICGLLLGRDDHVTEAVVARNVADDPAARFEIDPAMLIAAHRDARAGGPEVVGWFHSHPRGDNRPSATDAAMAQPDGRLWLILGGPPDHAPALWRAVRDGPVHGRFEPVALRTDPQAA
ncbi:MULTISPECIES: Mov34/MPN/PAD-1 family protein [unclassified Sphingomonas]|uniref:Mov34/MPN/PAD-1 family protein n=1 Tax=unclassified Sphingomonas TaxID=196159 RepID=UPI000835B279|nr:MULTISPECIES: M67 family metallopeptidase [unclassified Sphingomonas]